MGTVSSPTFFESPRKGLSVTYTKTATEFYHTAGVWDDTDGVSVSVDEVDPYTTSGTVYFYFDWQSGHAYHGVVNFSSPSHGAASPAPVTLLGVESRSRGAAAGSNGAASDGKTASKKKKKGAAAPKPTPEQDA